MTQYTLPQSERLRSLKAIRRMFGEGKSGFVYPFRYVFLAQPSVAEAGATTREAAGSIEVMFSVPKKFHKRANKRNLLKRRTREAYRQCEVRDELRKMLDERSATTHLALIYSTKEVHSYKTINNAVKRILEQVCAGV